MSDRMPGFYWVRPELRAAWTIAHYGYHPGCAVWLTHDGREWVDDDMAEIDERPIERNA